MKTIALTSQDLEQCNVLREEMQEPTQKIYIYTVVAWNRIIEQCMFNGVRGRNCFKY